MSLGLSNAVFSRLLLRRRNLIFKDLFISEKDCRDQGWVTWLIRLELESTWVTKHTFSQIRADLSYACFETRSDLGLGSFPWEQVETWKLGFVRNWSAFSAWSSRAFVYRWDGDFRGVLNEDTPTHTPPPPPLPQQVAPFFLQTYVWLVYQKDLNLSQTESHKAFDWVPKASL